MNYDDFIQAKVSIAPQGGFDITPDVLSPVLLPHQRDIVLWAVKGGNRAILKGRKGGGSELNSSYFFDAVQYLKAAEREVTMPDLFDALEEAA